MSIVKIPNFGINKFSYSLRFYYCGDLYQKLFGLINLKDVDELGVLVDDDKTFSDKNRLVIPNEYIDKLTIDFSKDRVLCTDDEFKSAFRKRFGFRLIDVIRPLVYRAVNNVHVKYQYAKSENGIKYFSPRDCEYYTESNKIKFERVDCFLYLSIIEPNDWKDGDIAVDYNKIEHFDSDIYKEKMFIDNTILEKLDKIDEHSYQPSLF